MKSWGKTPSQILQVRIIHEAPGTQTRFFGILGVAAYSWEGDIGQIEAAHTGRPPSCLYTGTRYDYQRTNEENELGMVFAGGQCGEAFCETSDIGSGPLMSILALYGLPAGRCVSDATAGHD